MLVPSLHYDNRVGRNSHCNYNHSYYLSCFLNINSKKPNQSRRLTEAHRAVGAAVLPVQNLMIRLHYQHQLVGNQSLLVNLEAASQVQTIQKHEKEQTKEKYQLCTLMRKWWCILFLTKTHHAHKHSQILGVHKKQQAIVQVVVLYNSIVFEYCCCTIIIIIITIIKWISTFIVQCSVLKTRQNKKECVLKVLIKINSNNKFGYLGSILLFMFLTVNNWINIYERRQYVSLDILCKFIIILIDKTYDYESKARQMIANRMSSVDTAIVRENNVKASEQAVNITSSHDVRNTNEQKGNNNSNPLSTPPPASRVAVGNSADNNSSNTTVDSILATPQNPSTQKRKKQVDTPDNNEVSWHKRVVVHRIPRQDASRSMWNDRDRQQSAQAKCCIIL